MSVTAGQLAKALAEAQAEFPPVHKTRTAKIKTDKGSYEYSYADLSDVLDAIRKPLSAHSLSFSQPIRVDGDRLVLVTLLMHESGESIESTYPLPHAARPQEMGSAITYARRYCLTALLGIAAEDDDDGQAAQDTKAAPKPKVDPRDKPLATLRELHKALGLTPEHYHKALAQIFEHVDTSASIPQLIGTLTADEIEALIEIIGGDQDAPA